MVVAACKAGIAGAFPSTNTRTLEEFDRWMDQVTGSLKPEDGPWVSNLITHSTRTRLADELKLVAEYKPPIVITALGSPRPVMETVKSYGGLVFADVVNLALAKKAADAGVDGMACICTGAGGHTGHLSPFAFISAIRESFDGTIAVGGAISDGAGIAGAIAAGADCVYMGTRFLPTEESRAQDAYKAMVIDARADDIVVSAAVTGHCGVPGCEPASKRRASMRRGSSNRSRAIIRAAIRSAGATSGLRARVSDAAASSSQSRAWWPDLEKEYRAAIARFAAIANA